MESTFTKNERKFFTPVLGALWGACGSEKSAGRYIVKKLWITADRCCSRWIFIESLAISWQKQYNKTNFESSHRQPGGLIMASKINKGEILAKFFDDGEYTALFADGAVSAACGYAAGQQAYAVY